MSYWDVVYDRLLALAPTVTALPSTAIYDGETTAQNFPPNYAIVGDDLQGNAGDYTQDFSDAGYMLDEQGTVNLVLVARSGDATFATLRTLVQGWVDNLRAQITADKRLGVLPPTGFVNVARVQIAQTRNQRGSAVTLVVSVAYFTRF